MTDDQFFLANAYLDGELAADEHARAESDPVVMAEVAALRELQGLVREVPPPDAAARDRAIAAAMEVFGSVGSTAATPAGTRPIPIRSRPSYARYLAVAAGVVGVGLVGVAIANSGLGGDDDSADVADEAAFEPTSEPAMEIAGDEAASDESGDHRLEEAPTGAADSPEFDGAADEPASDEPAAEEPASEPADEPADAADADDAPKAPDVELGQVLTTPEELGAYGGLLLGLRNTGELPPTPLHSCDDFANALGRVEYVDALAPEDGPLELLLDVREDEGYVVGFDPDACLPVIDGPLLGP